MDVLWGVLSFIGCVVGLVLRTVLPVSSWPSLPYFLLGDASRRAVVITGCDTGMGHTTARRLLNQGWTVFACCLTPQGCAEHASLKHERMVPLQMNVTNEVEVRACVKVVANTCAERGLSLDVLVSNAGISRGSFIEWSPVQSFRDEMEVNYLGCVSFTKAFLPLLKRRTATTEHGRKRIVIITSMLSQIPHFPGLAGYTASKHALDAYANCLRLEMKVWGVQVVNICPGVTATPFAAGTTTNQQRIWDTEASPDIKEDYGQAFFDWFHGQTTFIGARLAQPPGDVCHCIEHACRARFPKRRYYCGLEARLIARFVPFLPEFLSDFGMYHVGLFNPILGYALPKKAPSSTPPLSSGGGFFSGGGKKRS